MTTETTPKKLTATELREIKSLIKQDYRILISELSQRRYAIEAGISAEQNRREEEARAEMDKAFKSIQSRVDALNEAIVKVVEGLNAKGFVSRKYRGRNDAEPLEPTEFKLSFAKPSMVYLKDPQDLVEAAQQLYNEYNEAARELDRMEYLTTKDLVLEFVETKTASEFIRALPTVESMLAIPAGIDVTD